jgi:hypothetical protein
MRNTIMLTLTKLYDFDRTVWSIPDIEGEFETITGEAEDEQGKVYCIYNNCLSRNFEDRRQALVGLLHARAQMFVADTGKTTKSLMPKLKLLGFPGGHNKDSEGLEILDPVASDGVGDGEAPALSEESSEGGSTPIKPSSLPTVAGESVSAADSPSSDSSSSTDETAEMWEIATARLGSKGAVLLAVKTAQGRVVPFADITAEMLYRVVP